VNPLDYIDVLRATALQVDLDPDNLGPEFANLRTLHSMRLTTIWQDQEWPDLCPGPEQRFFRDAYNAALGYVATNEVFFRGPAQYFQALKTVPAGQAPATFSGNTWTTNSQYWAVSAVTYAASEYVAAAAYIREARVFYTPTGRVYQLHAATSTGNLPTDAAFWGVLSPFNRYVAKDQPGQIPFDHAFRAWDANPEITGRARDVEAWMSARGLQVLQNVPWIWLEYRRRRPRLSGDAFVATTIYATGQQVYFSSAAFPGNFYDCAATTAAGESPETTPGKWTLVEIPTEFENYLVQGAAADYLRPADAVRAAGHDGLAARSLDEARLVVGAQSAHRGRPNVRTR
jgi:hypothetical protein